MSERQIRMALVMLTLGLIIVWVFVFMAILNV